MHDGTATGQRVGGGAGGRGDYQPIGALPVDETVVDMEFEFDHLRRGTGVHHHVIEGVRPADDLALPLHLGVQQEAVFPGEMTVQHGRDLGGDFVRHDVGEKAQPAAIHPQHRGIVLGQGARGTEQAAVTADDDDQVGVLADLIAAGQAVAGIVHQFPQPVFQYDLQVAGLQQGEQLLYHLAQSRLLAAADQADSLE